MKRIVIAVLCLLSFSFLTAQTESKKGDNINDSVKSSRTEKLKIQLSPYFYTSPLDYSSRFMNTDLDFLLPFRDYKEEGQTASLTYDLIRSRKELNKFMMQQSEWMKKGDLGVFGEILATVNFAAAFGLIAAHLIKYQNGPGEDVHSKKDKKGK